MICNSFILAVDVETGEDAVFDNRHHAITPEHVPASASMPVLFDPAEIEGRRLVDGGMSANLPVRIAMDEPSKAETLCIALVLLPLNGSQPHSVDGAAVRAQDLIFPCQSRVAIQALRREHALRRELASGSPDAAATTTLVHLTNKGEERETAVKAIDLSKDSIRTRWASGKADMEVALGQLGMLPTPMSGSFSVVRLVDNSLSMT